MTAASDTRPYLDAAEVFVAPLRMARGVQTSSQALAMGLPSVASSAAWSGTVIPRGEGILVADQPREFAGLLAVCFKTPSGEPI